MACIRGETPRHDDDRRRYLEHEFGTRRRISRQPANHRQSSERGVDNAAVGDRYREGSNDCDTADAAQPILSPEEH